MKSINILYYISSHGFGHAARAGQVIRELIKNHTVYIKSMVPNWLLCQVIGKKPHLFRHQSDVGCLQTNNFDIDIGNTIRAYQEQAKANQPHVESELSFIKENKVDLLVSDIPSFPFLVAKKASIPSFFIGNFTWKSIYDFYLKDESHPIIKELKMEYGMATHSLITPLAMEMPELNNQHSINHIARKGNNIRKILNKDLHIPEGNKLVLFYSGNRGIEHIRSNLIQKIKGHTFISFYPLPVPAKNFIFLNNSDYPHQDIMASSDMAMIKPGYGMVSEALVNNVPIIYPPRKDFAEYFTFLKEFEQSGGTELISRDDFESGNWNDALRKAADTKYKKTYASNGAKECKQIIETEFR